MNPYFVDRVKDGNRVYFLIRYQDMSIVPSATKYLKHKTRSGCSPATVKMIAFSLAYYLTYLEEQGLQVSDVCGLAYDKQHFHFIEFLQWLKRGKHVEGEGRKLPGNTTCNMYLQNVFGWYRFMERMEETGQLSVLQSHVVSFTDSVGIRTSAVRFLFDGYLPEEEHRGRIISEEKIRTLLAACHNNRDRLILLLLAETGLRIGELLGIRRREDIDMASGAVRVCFREDNENGARAKNAEYRRAKISRATLEFLQVYLAEYQHILKDSPYLFVVLTGKMAGQAMDVNAVYAFLRRLELKTGIRATPHMLRHYFADQRRKNGWELLLISQALGHKQLATTEKYLHVTDEELRRASEEYFQKYQGLYRVEELV